MGKRESTTQFVDSPMRTVVQAMEPEAARLLTEQGGKVRSYELHGLYYWDYSPLEEQSVLSWPPDTFSVYVPSRGQEDTPVIFAAFRLPASMKELHLVYDHRLSSSSLASFEEFFTLRVAREDESVLCEPQEVARL